MYVRVNRPLGFMVGGEHLIVHPETRAQFLPDEAKDAAGFALLQKTGDIVVVEPEKAVEVKTEDKNSTKAK